MKLKEKEKQQAENQQKPRQSKNIIIMAVCGVLIIALSVSFFLNHKSKSVAGNFVYDVSGPRQNLVLSQESLPAGDKTILDEIDTKMTKMALYAQSRKAQLLYRMALTDKAEESSFVNKLYLCFSTDQTDEELLTNVNETFDVNITLEDLQKYENSIKDTSISTANFVDPSTKNNLDLAAFVTNAYNSGWGYVFGTYGKVLDQALVDDRQAAYPSNIDMYYDFIQANWMNCRVVDCVGLIKAYGWFDPKTGELIDGIDTGANGMPDIDANGMYKAATVKGKMEDIPETPGLAVWMNNHIGVYIGNGQVIEAMGTMYGVVKSDAKSRGWKGWCEIPYIEYID